MRIHVPRDPRGFIHVAEQADESATGDLFYTWALGIVFAAFLVWAAIAIMRMDVKHADVKFAWGAIFLSAAAFLHAHYFWSHRERFLGYAQLGKAAGLIGLNAGLIYLVYTALAFR